MCCYWPLCLGFLLGSCCVAAAANESATRRDYYHTDGGQTVYIKSSHPAGTDPHTVYMVKAEPVGEATR